MLQKLIRLLVCVLVAVPAFASVDYYLSVESSANFGVDPGGRARASIVVVSVCCRTNEASEVTLTVTLPEGVSNVSGSGAGWQCTANGNVATCTRSIAANTPPPYGSPRLDVDYNVPNDPNGMRAFGTVTMSTSAVDEDINNNRTAFFVVVFRTFRVDRGDDFAAGSLRDAIEQANDRCTVRSVGVPCKISFASPLTIEPLAALPAVTACNLIIDGGFERDATLDADRPVEISGAKAGLANGLELRSDCAVTVRGITINRFAKNGIVLAAPTATYDLLAIESTFIGTNTSATEARPNGMRGISVETADTSAQIINNVISGNRMSGIAVWAGFRLYVSNSRIGAGRDERPLGNGATGVFVNSGNATIHGFIAHNHDFGIAVGPAALNVEAYPDHVFDNGILDYDWGLDGPTLTDPSGRMPPVPVLISATYDPAKNATVVRGVLPAARRQSDPFSLFEIVCYDKDSRGYFARYPIAPLNQTTLKPGVDATWETTLNGDLRGHQIYAQSLYFKFADAPPQSTSELSAPIEPR